ncbi:MAG: histidinol-phosphatase [Chthoniobacteraceae bacterium]
MRILASLLLVLTAVSTFAEDSPKRWWKGNLHTHSLWSDGDDFPEMITAWYKENGYHFLAISDHNVLSDHERWISVAKQRGGEIAFSKYLKRFGDKWVELRDHEGDRQVRLKTLREFRVLFEEPDRFLMIQSEEITSRTIHINATNLQETILPYNAFDPKKSEDVVRAMQRVVNSVAEQRKRTGVPMFAHINHPNFQWAITAEELIQVENGRFFEVYNGHPTVHNEGDEQHASTDRVWDIILSERLRNGKSGVFGLATDDSHHYHNEPKKMSRTGRGWIVVRAAKLDVTALVAAIEAGDFYASSGVTLTDVKAEKDRLSLEIAAEPGVTYTTEFIGTRKGYDTKSEPVLGPDGQPLRVTRRYSPEIGTVLARTDDLKPTYQLKGDELYVRARITSSKAKPPIHEIAEVEQAWTQPLIASPRP